MRKSGTENEWMTSCEVMTSRTGSFTGTCSMLISRAPFGCWSFHIHCLATTWISIAERGGSIWEIWFDPAHQKKKRKANKVAAVQPISNSWLRMGGRGPRGAPEPRR